MSEYYDKCLICGKIVEGFEPQYCCNGMECSCMGQPTNPCVCSDECEDAVYKYIGFDYEDRRIKAGIELAS